MKSKWFILALVSVMLLSCVSESKKTSETPDEEGEKLDLYAEVLESWLKYPFYKYELTDFQLINRDSLQHIVFEFDSTDLFNDPHHSLYKYSPDSSRLLDLYSYNLIIEQNEVGQLRSLGRNTDSQVSLLDLKKRLNSRLLFVGPSTLIEDGFWINTEELLVVGHTSELGDSTYLPHFWHIDLASSTLSYYEYQLPGVKRQPDYLFRIKYPQLEFLSLP